MKVALGCDHAGFTLLSRIRDLLEKEGIEYLDLGCHGERCDYPVKGQAVGRAVAEGEADLGIVVCGTGIGISISANKVPGIRCALVSDCFSAEMCREHNDANVLALGGRVIGEELALRIVRIFLKTPFSHEKRHEDRIRMIEPEYHPTNL